MYFLVKSVKILVIIFIGLTLSGCSSGPLMVSHLSQDKKRLIKRKDASKHYFLSKVICFDRRCRGFIGYVASRDKKRFKGFKNESESFLFRERVPRRDPVIASNDPVDPAENDHFRLNTPTVFKHANFKTNSVQLEDDFILELNEFALYLLGNPNYQVNIIGHTDDVGSLDFNRQLSRDRAQSVVDHLVNQGVQQYRLTPVGMGNSQPLYLEESLESRRKNRRVEFEINSK